MQKVSWDHGAYFYHVVRINDDALMYYRTDNNAVSYIYNHEEGAFVDMQGGFWAKNGTSSDFDLGYKCWNITNSNYVAVPEVKLDDQFLFLQE